MTRPTSVVVVDDQAMIRQALGLMIDLEPDLTVVAQVPDAEAAVRAAADHRPDLMLLDVQLSPTQAPGSDGLSSIPRIHAASPGTRVVVLTTFGRPGYLTRALAAGAVGFLVKDAPADELLAGLRRVRDGEQVVDPGLAAASSELGPCPLSDRERLVLDAASHGGTTTQIARRVHLAEGTVRNTLSTAMAKLGAPTRADAVRIATGHGWIG